MTVFVDSNVLVFARDASEPRKQPKALAWIAHLWETGGGRVSVQVLHEYYVTVTKKLTPGLPRDEARDDIQSLLSWRLVSLDAHILAGAWAIEDRYGLSFWDALVVAAANTAGCRYLLTDDPQDRQEMNGTIVVSPFLHTPDSIA